MCRYIEEKYPSRGTELIPKDPKKRAQFEQAASVEQNNFHPYGMATVDEMRYKVYVILLFVIELKT
jgi:glutathione S-transferase